jgi:general secretion pathway protein G
MKLPLIKRIERLLSAIKHDKGFTLMEILIVVAIISILAILVIPNLIDEPNKARVQTAKLQMRNFSLALDKYYFDKGHYPDETQGFEVLKSEKYMKKIPNDPWGHPYVYIYPVDGDSSSYLIKSLGADGQEGGEDFNADLKSTD